MSQRLDDFLALEAGEYLSRMSRLLTGSAAPDPEELLRLARGIRGSAQMARAADVAEIAERLEGEARALATGAEAWDEAARERCLQVVAELESVLYEREGEVIPISDLFYDDEGPHVLSPATDQDPTDDSEDVPIGTLLYSGENALAAAADLEPEITGAVAAGDRARSAALVDELFDLIRLARSGPS